MDNVTVLQESIAGHHLWFSNMRMRAFLQDHGLLGLEVSFCKGCHYIISPGLYNGCDVLHNLTCTAQEWLSDTSLN